MREQFFKLIDHQQQFSLLFRWEDVFDRPRQPSLVFTDLIEQTLWPVDSYPQQGRLKFFKGVSAWHHFSNEPAIRARYSTATQRGDQPGFDETRFPTTTRPDQHQETCTMAGLLQSSHKL